MAGEQLYTSIQVSRMTGATGAQLRNWDKQGVLCARRTGEGISNNRKLYTDEDIETVRDILLFQELGMQLKEIRAILNAPEEERRRQIALCTERLRRQYSRLRGRIALSSVGEAAGTAHLREAAELAGGYGPLSDAYAEEENIQQVMRWIQTHPPKDLKLFAQELGSIAQRFLQLRESPDWHRTELAITDFCDFWSKRFGWPSAGQMLSLHAVFSEQNAMTAAIDEAAGAGTAEFIAGIFFLAWVSSALECLDNILAYLYRPLLGMDNAGASADDAIVEAADVLAAFACEFSNHAYAHTSEPSAEQAAWLTELAAAVFDLLEDAALDDELDCYLELEDFAAIDGPALESAQGLLGAHLEGRLDEWLAERGKAELRARAAEWLDALQVQWARECREGPTAFPIGLQSGDGDAPSDQSKDNQSTGDGNGGDGAINEEAECGSPLDNPAFRSWFDEWFARAHPTLPEAVRAHEDESIARMKSSLEAAACRKEE